MKRLCHRSLQLVGQSGSSASLAAMHVQSCASTFCVRSQPAICGPFLPWHSESSGQCRDSVKHSQHCDMNNSSTTQKPFKIKCRSFKIFTNFWVGWVGQTNCAIQHSSFFSTVTKIFRARWIGLPPPRTNWPIRLRLAEDQKTLKWVNIYNNTDRQHSAVLATTTNL